MNSSASLQEDGWTERDWRGLLLAIRHKKCTPFLGAGACAGILPLGRNIAQEWAKDYDYPFSDTDNLVRVAQYVAVHIGPDAPRYLMTDKIQGCIPPLFHDKNEPHRVLADLQLPLYVTTNYDNFMTLAIAQGVPPRRPRTEICSWYQARRGRRPKASPNPTPEEPVVFHLHGSLATPESMVLTEDDYLDFLMYISEDRKLIPPRIEEAFSDSSLLFMGYSLEDMDFKVLFRKLATYMHPSDSARHVSVQLWPPKKNGDEVFELLKAQRDYLARHFDLQKVKVYWGTCQDFATELRRRWESFNDPNS